MGTLERILRTQAAGGKAITGNRFLYGDGPAAVYVPGQNNGRERPLVSQREAGHHLQAFGGTEAIDIVMDAVGLYSDTASTAAWHLEKNGENVWSSLTDEGTDKRFESPQLLNLLRNPNPYQDYIELIELLVIDLLLVGNAYWLKYRMTADGRPLALYRLAPPYVKIKQDDQGTAKYYYQPAGVSEPVAFDPSEVIHFKRPNPHSANYGMGIIKGGGRPFDLELALTDATASYMENKADPSLIIQSERRVPRDVFNKLRAQLRARTSGTKRTGELLVLEAGLKSSTLTPTARDAMYAELADKSIDRILAMFRANRKLIGLPPAGADGTDKVQDIRREFDNKALRPFLDKLQTRITEGLVSAYGYTYHIDYRYTMSQEDAVKLTSEFGSIPGVKVSEVREFMVVAGMLSDASTGDSDIDEMVLNLPGNDLGPTGQPVDSQGNPLPGAGGAGFADRGLAGEAGRPPLGKNTKAFPKGGAPLPAGAAVRRPKASGKALPSMDEIKLRLQLIEDQRRIEGKAVETSRNPLPGEQGPKDVLAEARVSDADALIAQMREELSGAPVHALERALLDHAEGKAFDPKTTIKRIRESVAWETFRSMVADVMTKYAVRALSSASAQHSSIGIVPDEPLDYDKIAAELVNRPEGVDSVVGTLKKAVISKVDGAADAKPDVDAAIHKAVTDWRSTQAETVAMTEIVESYNEGSLLVMESAGVSDVIVFEEEDAPDEPCIEARGKTWPIAYARKHRTEHPRCRRAFVADPGTV